LPGRKDLTGKKFQEAKPTLNGRERRRVWNDVSGEKRRWGQEEEDMVGKGGGGLDLGVGKEAMDAAEKGKECSLLG